VTAHHNPNNTVNYTYLHALIQAASYHNEEQTQHLR